MGILAVALLTGHVPLLGVLGYELALWAALVGSLAGLDLGAAHARHWLLQRASAPAGPLRRPLAEVATLAARAVAATWLPLLLWALIAAVRGFWLPTCDWWFGVASFAAMPLAGGALAAGMGVALGLIIGRRRVLGTLAPLALALALVVAAAWRAYAAPGVFSYSPLLGYFPGNLYDELIELSPALAWARLEATLWVLTALGLAAAGLAQDRWRPGALRRRPGLLAGALATAAAAGALVTQSGALGYRPDAEDLQHALGGRYETEHFVIYHARTPAVLQDLKLIGEDHELRLAQVVATLGVAPRGKIHSYYFADDDQKARWMGARQVEMAKPWRRELYLSHAPFPHPSLRHEIAHAVAGEFGDRWFHVSAREIAGLPLLVNPGLIEGLAVAADWPGSYGTLTPHQATHAMQKQGVKPSIASLLSLRFLAVASARGYTTAGSFMRFLLDTRGAAALRELYRTGGDFQRAYGEPLAGLEQAWQDMIAALPVPPEEVEAVRERFRQVAVFDRACPHAVAARRARAFALVRQGEVTQAVELLRRVCSFSPAEPRFRLELADVLARGQPAQRQEAHALWRQLSGSDRVTSALRADALERLAVAAGSEGRWAQAQDLVAQALALPLSEDDRRQLEAMQLALGHQGPAGPALRGYFFPSPAEPATDPRQWATRAAEREPALGLALYLRGLRQADDGSWTEMADDLERSMKLGLPSPRFLRNAARRLAVAAYRTGDTGKLLQAISTLERPDLPEMDHWLAADWRDRLRFASTGHLDQPAAPR